MTTVTLLVYLLWCLMAAAWFATRFQYPLDRWFAALLGGSFGLVSGAFPVAFTLTLMSRI